MNLCGRKKEIEELKDALKSNKNEFVVVYGRRRVGKTYLIDEMFSYTYSFFATEFKSSFNMSKNKSINSFESC